MAVALNELPPGTSVEMYRHFHITSNKEDVDRMVKNFQRLLHNKKIQVISIGCDSTTTCLPTVKKSLTLISDQGLRRENLLFLLPVSLKGLLDEKITIINAKTKYIDIPSL